MSKTTFIDLIMVCTFLGVCVFAYYTAVTPYGANYWMMPIGLVLSICALWVNLINIQFIPKYNGVFKDV